MTPGINQELGAGSGPAPAVIRDEAELDEVLTRPRPVLVEFMRTLSSPLLILGAGGKMGPTLAVLARRAADLAGHDLDIVAVSRFSDARAREWLQGRGVRTVGADLFDRAGVRQLPDSANIIYLVGLKFGTVQNPSQTWAVNTLVPAQVMERYRGSRLVALSTGNVYPQMPANSAGASETTPLTPLGEYANSAVGRERIFEFFSDRDGTPVALLRLNYALDLRYGVLVDIARKVLAGEPVDLSNGFFNCIWQGDANEMIIRSLDLASSPATAWNLTSASAFSVRQVASTLGELLGNAPTFKGHEADTALLSDASKISARLGCPATSIDQVLPWTASWLRSSGRTLDKPTHFEVSDGRY